MVIIVAVIASNPAYGIDYSDALSNAENAFYIQTGGKETVKQLGDWAQLQVKQAGADKPLGATLFLYKVYRDKALSFKFYHQDRVTVNLNSVTLAFPF